MVIYIKLIHYPKRIINLSDIKIDNPLQMNDWEIKKFLTLIVSVHLGLLILILMDYSGLQIPILRQILGLFYLIFIPGILILRVLNMHNLGSITTLLYTVGLSIMSIMFIGAFINFIYPVIGISKPISMASLLITMYIFTLTLSFLSYKIDKKDYKQNLIDIKVPSPKVYLLTLILFLPIFGTYLVNYYNMNFLLMILILIISLIPILVTFNKIPSYLYPFTIFVISLSLLYHKSLISPYLIGWDVHTEYLLSNLVLTNSYWNYSINMNYNSMLSVILLAPVLSNFLNMDLTWIFKIVYPVIYSLVPLGMYVIFKKQTNAKIAFLSCFFFMSIFIFYSEMISLARQQIAELFLILIFLIIVDSKMDKFRSSLLISLFIFSLILSHYSISYIYIYCFIFAFLILKLRDVPLLNYLDYFKKEKSDSNASKETLVTMTFISLFVILTLSWYIFTSSSSIFGTLTTIITSTLNVIFTEFFNPQYSESYQLILQGHITILGTISKYLHLITQFSIFIGLLAVLKINLFKFKREYIALGIANVILLVASIAVPYLASQLNASRLYHISLLVLAPFCIIGGLVALQFVFKRIKWRNSFNNSLKIISIFLAVFLLFNTNFANEVTHIDPKSIALSKNSLDKYGDINSAREYYINSGYLTQGDIAGMYWLLENKNNHPIYADRYYYSTMFESYGGFIPNSSAMTSYLNSTKLTPFNLTGTVDISYNSSYLYLGTFNSKYNMYLQDSDIKNLSTSNKSIIYYNGNSKIVYY